MYFIYLFIYYFIAQVLKVCRTPGPPQPILRQGCLVKLMCLKSEQKGE